MMTLFDFLDKSLTAYHAVENATAILKENGFEELKENESFAPVKGGKYFVRRNGSALIAFSTGEKNSFNIVASHADSPCFKIKASPAMTTGNTVKLNVERYGGGLNYTFLDRPVTIAGRVVVTDGKTYESKAFTSAKTFVIPSVAIHFNRTANDGIKLNPQTDMCPLISAIGENGLEKELTEFAGDKTFVDADLFVVPAQKPFKAGYSDELFCSPRIDNLTSAYCSLAGLIKSTPKAIDVCFIADNEEVGSQTRQGAGADFLQSVTERISLSLRFDFRTALADSFMVSFDNAHAVHPNHPELSDPTNKTVLGGGIAIKRHANFNYTTDAVSSAVIKGVWKNAGVKYQDFYMRSDLPCGGTLGAISSSHLSVLSVDVGLPQLAMHSACETACLSDVDEGINGVTAFYSVAFSSDGDGSITVK